jgi:hypothetical protein
MKNRNTFLLLFHLIAPLILFPQAVVSTSGSFFAGQHGSVSFTVGETITGSVTNGSGFVFQGYQQPWVNITGVEELSKTRSFSIFPNPASEAFQLSGTLPDNTALITISDTKGRVLLTKSVCPDQSIEVSFLPNGFYLVIIETDETRQIEKLIIN